jgi:hypothetical protein
MFRALLAHPQEALHSGTEYMVCVLGRVAATRDGVELQLHSYPGGTVSVLPQPTDMTNAIQVYQMLCVQRLPMMSK